MEEKFKNKLENIIKLHGIEGFSLREDLLSLCEEEEDASETTAETTVETTAETTTSTPEEPKQEELPNTGATASLTGAAIAAMLTGFGVLGFKKKED